MWVRRLGIPHLWPSRVKVIVLSIASASFIFELSQFMGSVGYEALDLENPHTDAAVCRMTFDKDCWNSENALLCLLEEKKPWEGLSLSEEPCSNQTLLDTRPSCRNATVPIMSLAGEDGQLHSVNVTGSFFNFWTDVFLVLTYLMVLGMMVHDLAVLNNCGRKRVYSLSELRRRRPLFWNFAQCMLWTRCLRRIKRKSCWLWAIILPFWVIVQLVNFVLLLYPATLLAWLCAPIGMTRIVVFSTGIITIVWSVFFGIAAFFMDFQVYSVVWNNPYKMSSEISGCVCYCEYTLNRRISWNALVVAVLVAFQAFSLSFRALKGLRRQNWTNLFSVLYTVPLESYPVKWTRPQEEGGGPIKWRKEYMPVQSEPAFDPFALMDEQPESALLCAPLAPAIRDPQHRTQSRHCCDPVCHSQAFQAADPRPSIIGCCGFPYPGEHGEGIIGEGDVGRFRVEEECNNSSHSEDDEEAEEASGTSVFLSSSTSGDFDNL